MAVEPDTVAEPELVRPRPRRDRRRFPKLSPIRVLIVIGLSVLYFIFQDKLWKAAIQAAFGTIYFILSIIVVCSILGPLVWYLGRIVFPGIWRARRLRILRYRRALRDCNYRQDS